MALTQTVLLETSPSTAQIATSKFQPAESCQADVLVHRAARLSVAEQDAEREGIISSNFWPEHIGIRLWAFPDVRPGDESWAPQQVQ